MAEQLTASDITADIRRKLAAGDTDMAMRLLLDGAARLSRTADPEALAAPEPIGQERWDALLAGVLRYHLHQAGLRTPKWTYREPLDKFWWPTQAGIHRGFYDMANAPMELARLGIFLSKKDLTSA